MIVFRERIDVEAAARWAMVGVFFLFPIKTNLSNVFLAVMLVLWVASRQFRKRWVDIKGHPITLPALLMYGLVVVGIVYTSAEPEEIGRHLRKYSKFLIVLVCMTLLTEVQWRRRCRLAFMSAMVFVVASTYANIWFNPPWSSTANQGWGVDHTVVKDYIFQGLCTAIFVPVAMSEAFSNTRWKIRFFWGVVALLAALSCLFLLNGRTGLLALGASVALYLVAITRGRLRLAAIPGLCVLAAGLVLSSGIARNKFIDAWHEIDRYQQAGQSGALIIDLSSTGARLMMWKLSVQEITKRPVFGGGTASYHEIAANRLQNEQACAVACAHPHNQFLFFGVEYGLIGIGVFFLYFLRAAQYALSLSPSVKASTLAFIGVFMIDSLVHGSMWLSGEQHLFTFMLALWMSYPQVKANLPAHSSSERLAG